MIYEYRDDGSWLAIVASVFVIEILTILIIRPISSNSRVWYSHFGIVSVIADVGIILLDFAVSRYVFAAYGIDSYSPWAKASIFSATLLWLQIVHDMLYYHIFVKRIFASSGNGIVEFMRKYGSDGQLWPIVGDSIMVVLSGLFAHALSTVQNDVSIIVLIFAIYVIPYMISPKFSPSARHVEPSEAPPSRSVSAGVIVCTIPPRRSQY